MLARRMPKRLATNHRLGKYKLKKRLAEGSFGVVYRALDTVEGVHVALKVPRQDLVTKEALGWFRKEVRLHAGLDHPNVLLLKSADLIDGRFVVAYTLGTESLGDRMGRRMSVGTFLALAEQMLEAVAHAHARNVIHCDLKPENFILFEGGRVRLSDFSISRMAKRTVSGSGSGTVGYVAPEQAMGKTSFRADVFSLGLILYEMLAGTLPEWPYPWPLPGLDRVRRKVPDALVAFLQRALAVAPQSRFRDGQEMLAAWKKLRPRVRRHLAAQQRSRRRAARGKTRDWKHVRFAQFRRQFGAALELRDTCRCGGPIAATMSACPWCGKRVVQKEPPARFPAHCPRCRRGRKLDWRFCPWCHGPRFKRVSEQHYGDRRYTSRCAEPTCRGPLMPFMRYCPWCRRRVRKGTRIEGSSDRCAACGFGVVRAFWEHCPWCARRLRR